MARLPRGAGARSAVARAARRTLADAETAVFDANILAGAATAARKVRDAAIVSVCARTRLCVPRLLAALSSRERETRRSPGREARVYWSTRSTSALADETAKRFRGRDFLNPERRVRASRDNRKGAPFTSRLARDDRSGNSVILIPPRYPFKRVAKPRFEANPGELFRVACEPTPQHRRTGPHRRTSHHGEEEHQVQGQGQGGAGACPATRRSRVRMPVLILSPASFFDFSAAPLRGGAGRRVRRETRSARVPPRASEPRARAAVGAPRRATGSATGSASASRRFARLTYVIHPSRRRCDVFPKQAKTNNKKAKSAATPRKASSAWTAAENAALAAGVAKHGAGTSPPETRSATIAEHPARFPHVRADARARKNRTRVV